jgi:superfamily I DNA/RNA helicase
MRDLAAGLPSVALTRAREHLYLTYSQARQLGGREQTRQPSRFLRALPREHLTASA